MREALFDAGMLASMRRNSGKRAIMDYKLRAEQRHLDRLKSANDFMRAITSFDTYYKQEEEAYKELHGTKGFLGIGAKKGAYDELLALMDKKLADEKSHNEYVKDEYAQYGK